MPDGTDRTELTPRTAAPRILDVDLRGVDLANRDAVREAYRKAMPLPPGPERDRALAALAEVKSAPGYTTAQMTERLAVEGADPRLVALFEQWAAEERAVAPHPRDAR
jgi:hypothetical protein